MVASTDLAFSMAEVRAAESRLRANCWTGEVREEMRPACVRVEDSERRQRATGKTKDRKEGRILRNTDRCSKRRKRNEKGGRHSGTRNSDLDVSRERGKRRNGEEESAARSDHRCRATGFGKRTTPRACGGATWFETLISRKRGKTIGEEGVNSQYQTRSHPRFSASWRSCSRTRRKQHGCVRLRSAHQSCQWWRSR